jgi:N-acetylated-alpha-linked acidic dipeptidase
MPTFGYGRALAQTAGTAVMRLADASLLPFNFGDLSAAVGGYVGDLKRLAGRESAAIRDRNRQIAEGVFNEPSDPSHPFVAPRPESEPPPLDFAALDAARDELARAADQYQRSWGQAGQTVGAAITNGALDKVNQELLRSERALTDPNGLPGRPWYKHQLYAPGFYTGYGVKTIPAVREAIEQKQWTLAQQSIVSVAKVIAAEAAAVERAAADLDAAQR